MVCARGRGTRKRSTQHETRNTKDSASRFLPGSGYRLPGGDSFCRAIRGRGRTAGNRRTRWHLVPPPGGTGAHRRGLPPCPRSPCSHIPRGAAGNAVHPRRRPNRGLRVGLLHWPAGPTAVALLRDRPRSRSAGRGGGAGTLAVLLHQSEPLHPPLRRRREPGLRRNDRLRQRCRGRGGCRRIRRYQPCLLPGGGGHAAGQHPAAQLRRAVASEHTA